MKAPINFRSISGYFLSLFCLLIMAFAFGSCKKETQEEELMRKIKEEDEKSIQAYLEHHSLADSAVRTASGLYYIKETATEGERADWAALATKGLSKAYGDSEPKYTTADLRK